MDVADNGFLRQLDEFLSRPNQSWLLGAGISKDAGMPSRATWGCCRPWK